MIELLRDTARRALNVAHIRSPLACAGGSIHRDKNEFAVIQSFLIAGRKTQAPRVDVALHQFFHTWFINRQYTLFEQLDLLLHNINAYHLVAQVGKTRAGHQTYISCSNHTNVRHNTLLLYSHKRIFIFLFYNSRRRSMSRKNDEIILQRI